MTTHSYSGPISAVTLSDGREISWFPGRTYVGLPVDHPYIAGLIANRILIPVEPDPEPDPEPGAAKASKAKANTTAKE
jgi:hypothetical protein